MPHTLQYQSRNQHLRKEERPTSGSPDSGMIKHRFTYGFNKYGTNIPNSKITFFHPPRRAFTSDWTVNSFVMVVYEKIVFRRAFDRKFSLNF